MNLHELIIRLLKQIMSLDLSCKTFLSYYLELYIEGVEKKSNCQSVPCDVINTYMRMPNPVKHCFLFNLH